MDNTGNCDPEVSVVDHDIAMANIKKVYGDLDDDGVEEKMRRALWIQEVHPSSFRALNEYLVENGILTKDK